MVEKFHTVLRDKGRSITKSRTLLFEYLQESGAVSPGQFMEDNIAVADRASLYRTLLLFRTLGVVEDRIVNGRRLVELTDRFNAHHHHLTCENCGKTIPLAMPSIEKSLVELCRQQGFKVTGHVIEATGLCQACQINNSNA